MILGGNRRALLTRRRPLIVEAVCGRCGETFLPDTTAERPCHETTEDGAYCGGSGVLAASYHAPGN